MFTNIGPFVKKRCKNIIADFVIERSLGSTRANTKHRGTEILLLFVELEDKADSTIVTNRYQREVLILF